jgi:crotonobetainyl-CoA:carnitine CoA-transferase CaiB-like acyl-CoA transferase
VTTEEQVRKGALSGLKVLDIATVFAGPMAATMLGDFGADVIKVEHPTKADSVRWHGASKDGVGLWWKIIGRNKRTITLYLGSPEGQEVLKQLVVDADVLIENFRPGTLERWGLSPEILHEINPGLVIARVTGFGQFGPYSSRPGFGTLAEAMSGFAAITGEPDGPPTLPPFGLADGIAGLTAAYAIMVALHSTAKMRPEKVKLLTWQLLNRFLRCSDHRLLPMTNSVRSSHALATVRVTTLRATRTRPKMAAGWRFPRVPKVLPNG